MTVTKIPTYLEAVKVNGTPSPRCVKCVVNFDNPVLFYNKLATVLLGLKNTLRYDTAPRTTVLVTFIEVVRW